MQKKILLTLVSIGLFSGIYAQGIQFEQGSWQDVQKKAKDSGKYIFVDAFTTWCGPCKWMAKNIFPNDTAGQFYNKNFVNYKFDMEKGEGIEFAKKYKVHAYPSFLFFNPAGELMHECVGGRQLSGFLFLGKNALDPEMQLASLEKRYGEGKRDSVFLVNYGTALGDANKNAEFVVSEFLKVIPSEKLINKGSYEFISNLSGTSSDGFQFIMSHKNEFYKTNSEEEVNGYIINNLIAGAGDAGKKGDVLKLNQLKDQLKKFAPLNQDELLAELNFVYYSATSDVKLYFTAAIDYIDKYKLGDYQSLNQVAWEFFEEVEDQLMLEKALGWAKISVDLKREYANTDTYANLFFKMGKLKEAKEWAEIAIELAKKEGEDYKSTEDLLENIKRKIKK